MSIREEIVLDIQRQGGDILNEMIAELAKAKDEMNVLTGSFSGGKKNLDDWVKALNEAIKKTKDYSTVVEAAKKIEDDARRKREKDAAKLKADQKEAERINNALIKDAKALADAESQKASAVVKSESDIAKAKNAAASGDLATTKKLLDQAKNEKLKIEAEIKANKIASNSISSGSSGNPSNASQQAQNELARKAIELHNKLLDAKLKLTEIEDEHTRAMAANAVTTDQAIKKSEELATKEENLKKAVIEHEKAKAEYAKDPSAANKSAVDSAYKVKIAEAREYKKTRDELEEIARKAIATDNEEAQVVLENGTKRKNSNTVAKEAVIGNNKQIAESAKAKAKADQEALDEQKRIEKEAAQAAAESVQQKKKEEADLESLVSARAGNVKRAQKEMDDAKRKSASIEKEINLIDDALYEERAKLGNADLEKIKALQGEKKKLATSYIEQQKEVARTTDNVATAEKNAVVTTRSIMEAVKELNLARKEQQQKLKDLANAQDQYNKNSTPENEKKLESAYNAVAASVERMKNATNGMNDLNDRAGGSLSGVADAAFKTGEGLENVSLRSGHLSRAIYYTAQAAQDLNYGFVAIINNLPLITEAFAKAAGADHQKAMAWAAGVGFVTAAFQALITLGPKVYDFFKAIDLTTLEGQMTSVKNELTILNGMSYVFNVDQSQLFKLESKLKDLEDREKLLKANLEKKSVDEVAAEEAASKVLSEHGGERTIVDKDGKKVQVKGGENIKNVLMSDDSFLTKNEKEEVEQLRLKLEKAKEMLDEMHENGDHSYTLANLTIPYIESQIKGIEGKRAKRVDEKLGNFSGAVPGSEAEFSDIVKRNRKALEESGVDVDKILKYAPEVNKEKAKQHRLDGTKPQYEQDEEIEQEVRKSLDPEGARKIAKNSLNPLQDVQKFNKNLKEKADKEEKAPEQVEKAIENRSVSKTLQEAKKELDKFSEEMVTDAKGSDHATAYKKMTEKVNALINNAVTNNKSIPDNLKSKVAEDVIDKAISSVESDYVGGGADERIAKAEAKSKARQDREKRIEDNKDKRIAQSHEKALAPQLDMMVTESLLNGKSEEDMAKEIGPKIEQYLQGIGMQDQEAIEKEVAAIIDIAIQDNEKRGMAKPGGLQEHLQDVSKIANKKQIEEQKAAQSQANSQMSHYQSQVEKHANELDRSFGGQIHASVARGRINGMDEASIMQNLMPHVYQSARQSLNENYSDQDAMAIAQRMIGKHLDQNRASSVAHGARNDLNQALINNSNAQANYAENNQKVQEINGQRLNQNTKNLKRATRGLRNGVTQMQTFYPGIN